MKETYNILEPIRSLEFSDSFIEFYSQLDENILLFLNGFIKKSTKDYNKQIKKAETILKSSELWNGKNI